MVGGRKRKKDGLPGTPALTCGAAVPRTCAAMLGSFSLGGMTARRKKLCGTTSSGARALLRPGARTGFSLDAWLSHRERVADGGVKR